MSALSVVILVFAGIAYFTYCRIKDFPRIMISSAFNHYDYKRAIEILDGVGAKKLLGDFEHDQLLLKAYFMAGMKDEFLQQIDSISKKSYKHEKAMTLLSPWYYQCLRCQAKEFADSFLDALKACGDEHTIVLARISYRVLLEDETEDLESIEALIAKQKDASFTSGLLYYLKGKILFKTNVDASLHAFDSALFNFEAAHNSIYYQDAKATIDRYGNEKYLHYGSQDIPTVTNSILDIDVGARYRVNAKKENKKKQIH